MLQANEFDVNLYINKHKDNKTNTISTELE